MNDLYTGGKSREISALYQGLLKSRGNSTMYVKEKWERELGIEITEEEWYNVCRIQHSTTASRLWRESGWKNIIRYFITPNMKGRYAP